MNYYCRIKIMIIVSDNLVLILIFSSLEHISLDYNLGLLLQHNLVVNILVVFLFHWLQASGIHYYLGLLLQHNLVANILVVFLFHWLQASGIHFYLGLLLQYNLCLFLQSLIPKFQLHYRLI